jgi:hypothetical protein
MNLKFQEQDEDDAEELTQHYKGILKINEGKVAAYRATKNSQQLQIALKKVT